MVDGKPIGRAGGAEGEAAQDPPASALVWGLLQPRWPASAGLSALRTMGPRALAKLVVEHKVSRLAKKRAEQAVTPDTAGDISAFLDQLGELCASALRRRETLADTIRLVEQAGHDIPWWPMKGVAMAGRYPDAEARDIGDLDVHVRDVDDMWVLTRRLTAHDYVYADFELPWFKQDRQTGAFYGQVRLVARNRDRMSVDIHGGRYSVRHCGLLPVPRYLAGPGGALSSAEDDLCAVIVNAAGDCVVNAKLVNDLTILLRQPVDHHLVAASLGEAGLLPYLALVLNRAVAWCTLTDEQRHRLDRLMPDVEPEPEPPLTGKAAGLRADITVRHAAGLAARRYGPQSHEADLIVRSAEAAYRVERPQRLGPAAPLEIGPDTLNNWTCIRMVPVANLRQAHPHLAAARSTTGAPDSERSLTRQLTVLSTPDGHLVRVGPELFVPTVDFELNEALVRRALAVDGR